jgi:hypothetical protein
MDRNLNIRIYSIFSQTEAKNKQKFVLVVLFSVFLLGFESRLDWLREPDGGEEGDLTNFRGIFRFGGPRSHKSATGATSL